MSSTQKRSDSPSAPAAAGAPGQAPRGALAPSRKEREGVLAKDPAVLSPIALMALGLAGGAMASANAPEQDAAAADNADSGITEPSVSPDDSPQRSTIDTPSAQAMPEAAAELIQRLQALEAVLLAQLAQAQAALAPSVVPAAAETSVVSEAEPVGPASASADVGTAPVAVADDQASITAAQADAVADSPTSSDSARNIGHLDSTAAELDQASSSGGAAGASAPSGLQAKLAELMANPVGWVALGAAAVGAVTVLRDSGDKDPPDPAKVKKAATQPADVTQITFELELGADRAVGDKIQLRLDNKSDLGTAVTLDATQVTAGKITITLAKSAIGEGTHSITAAIVDAAGNRYEGTDSAFGASVLIDLTPPPVPTIALQSDTGASGSDKITSVATLTVGNTESGASIQYSANGGTTWAATAAAVVKEGANTIVARQVDADGNASAASTALAFTLDTNAPDAAVVTLAATQPTDVTKVSFTVTLGADAAATDSVQLRLAGANLGTAGTPSSGVATITVDKSALSSGANVITAKVTDVAGNAFESTSGLTVNYNAGTVSDGYVAGASVYADVDGSGTLTSGDKLLGLTDAKGDFNVVLDDALKQYALVAVGGTDISTGLPFAGAMTAPAGSSVLTPLTTLINAIVKTGVSTADAVAKVATALGLPSGVDLTKVDVLAATLEASTSSLSQADAIRIQAAAVQVSTVLSVATTALASGNASADSGALAATVATKLADAVLAASASAPVKLNDASVVATVITQSATAASVTVDATLVQGVATAVANVVTAFQAVAENAANSATAAGGATADVIAKLTQLVQVQTVALDGLTTDLKEGTFVATEYDDVAEVVTLAKAVTVEGKLTESVTGSGTGATESWTDTTAPTVEMTTYWNNGPVGEKTKVYFQVVLSEGVVVGATLPVLNITIGGQARQATYSATLSTADYLVFSYTIAKGDNGDVRVASLDAGSVKDILGNALNPALDAADLANSTLAADTTPPASPSFALTNDSGISATDGITNDGRGSIKGLETGAKWEYSTDGGKSWTAGTGESLAITKEGSTSLTLRQTDALGNQGEASVAKVIQVDTVAPTAEVDSGIISAITGETKVTMTFSEAVYTVTDLFDLTDITVIGGGQKGTTFGADLTTNTYEFSVIPAVSLTAKEQGFSIASGVIIDTAGNGFAGASEAVSLAVGTSADETLVTSAARDVVFTGGGTDVVKFTSAAKPAGGDPDLIFGFDANDKIDLTSILGTGGSGYTSSTIGDSGAGFVELKNVKLTKLTSTTTVEFDITLDAATYGGSKVSGITIDLKFDGAAVTSRAVTIPSFDMSGTATAVWYVGTNSLVGSSASGLLSYASDPDPATFAANPIVDANGKVLTVKLTLSGLVDTFNLGLESKVDGGNTYITTADGKKHYVDVGIAKTAGKVAGADGVLEIFADTSTLGTVGDNQLRYSTVYDATTQTTRMSVRYDTDPKIGSTVLSDVMLVDFGGNLTSIFGTNNLVPL